MTSARELARICKVLSVDTRVRIIQLLKKQPLCVCALSARLGITAGAVSQHLRILRDAGLVTDEKRGYYTHYRLNDKSLSRWKDITERFLETEPAGAGRSLPDGRQRRKSCAKKRKAVAGTRKTSKAGPKTARPSRSKNVTAT